MFTGLIKEVGTIQTVERKARVALLTINAPLVMEENVSLGDSIAVNGICLTVTGLLKNAFQVQAVYETEERSTVKNWQSGQKVNLERPLTLRTMLDGHLVTGHVDSVVTVKSVQMIGEAKKIIFSLSDSLSKYIAEKGSVTLDGISLTVAEKKANDSFAVAVIPHTLIQTNAQYWKVGNVVNLEVDIVARYLESLIAGNSDTTKSSSSLSMTKLNELGML